MQIFREQQPGTALCGHVEHQRIPAGQLMRYAEIHGPSPGGGIAIQHRKRIHPTEHGVLGLLGGATGFAGEYAEQLAEALQGQHHIGIVKLLKQCPGGAHPRTISKALGIDQKIGVECGAHQS